MLIIIEITYIIIFILLLGHFSQTRTVYILYQPIRRKAACVLRTID